MVLFTSFLTTALFAGAALAIPTKNSRLENRLARRGLLGDRTTRPLQLTEGRTTALTNVSHPEVSSNWAGAVFESASGTWKSVTASFVVPTPRTPSGGSASTTYSASAWVGIDGDTCGNAILQTGVDFTVRGTAVSFDAWYEWFPDFAHDFTGFPISAGQTIQATVTATSTTGGTATLHNVNTGTTVSHTFSGQPALCEQNAEWIVEDFESGGGQVPFANFGTVTFSGASAKTASSTVGPSGATIIEMQQGNTVLTSVTTSSNSVTVRHT